MDDEENDLDPRARAYRAHLQGLTVEGFHEEASRVILISLRATVPQEMTDEQDDQVEACFDEAAVRSPGLYTRIHAECVRIVMEDQTK